MAIRKRATKRRLASCSHEEILEKVKRAFNDIISTSPNEFLPDEEGSNGAYILQLWDCFADVYPKIQSLKPGQLSTDDKRQIVADLMVWSSMDAYDQGTKQFFLAPHLQDTTFVSTGRYLREAMAERGMLASRDKTARGTVQNDAESQASNSWGSIGRRIAVENITEVVD